MEVTARVPLSFTCTTICRQHTNAVALAADAERQNEALPAAMKRDRRPAFDDDDDDGDEAVVHAPGSTAELVARVLADEQKKKQRDGGHARVTVLPSGEDSDDERRAKREQKSVSFAEDVEEADDEALAARAKAATETRALLRSEMAAGVRERDDVNARSGVEDAEEIMDGDQDNDGGFTSFNLDKERQEGYFDDDGNYVEYAEEEDETSLWLDKDAKVDERLASGAIRRSTAAFEEEENAKAMTEREVAMMQREIASYLKPGETVLGALKRLGGSTKKGGGGPPKQQKVMTDEDKKIFDKLTELSSALMGQGEYEVYTFQKEAFERAANLFAPSTAPPENAGGKDMFADSEDEEDAPPAKRVRVEEEATTSSSTIDFTAMGVKALKAYIQAHGGKIDGNITEKSELIALAKGRAPPIVPEGYAWNADHSLYYCEASDLFFDHSRNLFTDAQRSAWWIYDQNNGFVEWSG